jgi:hypothetical protein
MSFKVISISKFDKQAKRLVKKYPSLKKAKGKSGGARVITHLHVTDTTIFLLSIYDKSEQDSITDKELSELIMDINQ